MAQIRSVFERIRDDLNSSYLVIAESRAPRRGRWCPVEVRLSGLDSPGKYEIRSPGGLFW